MRKTGTLKRMFEHKAWANDALLTAMAQLDAGAPSTEIAIRALNHTLIVDQIFAAHMRGEAPAHAAANADDAPTLAALAAALRASDRGYVDYVCGLDDAGLAERIDFSFTDGEPGRMSREEMLMHLISHGAGHRGQIGCVMALEGVAPPTDGMTTYLHVAEAESRRRVAGHTAAPSAATAFAGRLTPAVETPAETPANTSPLDVLTDRMRLAARGVRLGKTVRFDLKGEGVIFVGDGDATNAVRSADLTVTVSLDDLRAIAQGRISPMSAITSGRLALSSMGLAMSIQGPLKALLAAAA